MSDASNSGGDGDGKPAKVSLFGRRSGVLPPRREPPKMNKRRRRTGLSTLSGFVSFVLFGAFIGLAAFGAALVEVRRDGPLDQDKVVILTREDDGGPIAEQLERNGVIDSALLFSALSLVDGSRGALKRGEYAFRAHMSLRDVERLLISGKVVLHKITIPEGLTSDQIVQRLRDNDILIGDVKEPPREGSLLPETYSFPRGETRQALLIKMTKDQAKMIDDVWKRRAADLPIKSPGELVTLASLIERETGKTDERAHVAGVFVNRLQKHIKLQSDPTIVYGLVFGKGTLGHPITRTELNTSTPYNTYYVDGLPPGPICNPGKAALEAAASPDRTRDLYFVADGTGGHVFAETLDQHLKNVARWRQIEQGAKDKLAPDAAAPGTPAPAPAPTRGEVPSLDPKVFGALPPPPAPHEKPDTATKKLIARLERIAEERRKQIVVLGPDGPLSPGKLASAKTIDELGAVVTGVNDAPEVVKFDDTTPAPAPPESPVVAYTPNPANRGKVFDASEGTPLDPLLNKNYDLATGKTIPSLK